MIFEKDSRICLCTRLKINKIEELNKTIRLKWKELHKETKIKKDLNADLRLRYHNQLFPFEYMLEIESFSLKKLKEMHEQKKKDLEEIYKKSTEENKEEIEKRIAFIEKAYEEGKEFFNPSRLKFRIDLVLEDSAKDSKIFESFDKLPEKPIFYLIEESIDESFEVTLCAFINFNKKLDLMHGYEFNRKLDFPKEINEQLGDAFIKMINLNIVKSPLGIKEIEFGEDDDYKMLNIKIKFSDNKLSNLLEKIKILLDIIKLFIIED